MEQPTLVKPELTIGHQMPWHDCVFELFGDALIVSTDASFLALLAIKPQLWAIHSVQLEWGHVGILSISHLDIMTGALKTGLVTLPYKGQPLLKDEVLSQIGEELRGKIFEEIDQALEEMNNVLEGAATTMPMTSTHIAVECVRANRRDIAAARLRQRIWELN